ncbi:hypothetical protein EJB05_06196, partial [Eragrostis curvula]
MSTPHQYYLQMCPRSWHISVLSLLTHTLLVSSSSLSPRYTDFSALLLFKSHIVSDPGGALSSWDAAGNDTKKEPHFCQWTGVSCSNRRYPGRVTGIRLRSFRLAGSISPDLSNLTRLRFLNLSSNNLVGDIPISLCNCIKLRAMNLSANYLSGFLPDCLGRLSKLTMLSVGHNNLTGEIPTALSNITSLMILKVEMNSFHGQIHSSLCNLTSLTQLFFGKNRFSGNIPSNLDKITNLVLFDVQYNELEGPVPPSLFNISSIKILNLGFNQLKGSLPLNIGFKLPRLQVLGTHENNQFEGPIPASLSNASELGYLLLRGNRYHGVIPRDIGIKGNLKLFSVGHNDIQATTPRDWDFITSLTNCSNLNILDLENNNFVGAMPVSTANLSRELEWLTIGRNHISGSIALWLGTFHKLTKLILADNLFTGPLPKDIGLLSSLQYLDLSHNGFQGQIPQSLGNITQLSNLSLSNNCLDSSIPASLGNLTYIGSIDLSCNFLRGQIPLEILSIPSLTILLNLSTNALSGSIPSQIGRLNSLGKLDLSTNKITGEIPDAIGSCVELCFLYLQGNLLQCQIPKGLKSLSGLQNLDLSNNNLQGPIPEFLQNFTLLTHLNLSFNNLSGPVPCTGIFRNSTILSLTGNTMLCGGPTFLNLRLCQSAGYHKASQYRLHILMLCIFLGSFIFFICSATAYCFMKRMIRSSVVDNENILLTEELERISYAELDAATESFSPTKLIGSGSFGNVYVGNLIIDENLVTVAIKVLNVGLRGAHRSFMNECDALRRIRHRNLVKVVTVCSSLDHNGDEFKALILEFICNGSLDEWLHTDRSSNSTPFRQLTLMKRLYIALDVAEALVYLHHHIEPPIVHCDIKPSNILLDDDMVAHVTDFGLAKILNPEALKKNSGRNESSSFVIKGTIGYVPPEYGSGSEVSTDGDVYSYGVLLMEIFTGRRPTDSLTDSGTNLINYVQMAYPKNLLRILDVNATYSTDTHDITDLLICPILRLALACCHDTPSKRIKMDNVVAELNAIKNACSVHMPAHELRGII